MLGYRKTCVLSERKTCALFERKTCTHFSLEGNQVLLLFV